MGSGVQPTDVNAAPQLVPTWQPPRWRLRRGASVLRDIWQIRSDPTYRRLARSYELPDGNRRVYCYHIRKTAGTSLVQSFMALGGEDPMEVWRRTTVSRLPRTISGRYSFAVNHRRLLAEGAYFYGRSHHAAADQPLPRDTFTVTILRDPIARVHSYFDYLVKGDDPDLPVRVSDQERRKAEDGFDEFLNRVPTEHLLNQLSMFSKRFDVSEAADRIAGCSSVFFTEDFTDGLAALAGHLELPLTARQARVTGARSPLTDEQRERLRSRLEPEYELLRHLEESGIARMGSTRSA
jgi:Sulfotransferase family